jgi:hypothetical protein
MQVNNIYMNQTLKKLTPLLVVFTVLLSSNFINAAWSNPTATPPGDNPLAPINESLDNQLKQGDITARNLKAGLQMWSPEYCDEAGENCFSAASTTSGDAASGIDLFVIRTETKGQVYTAHAACQSAGYDGLWSFSDRSGTEDVMCFRSSTMTISLPANNWVQKTGASCTATCSALGKTLGPDPNYNNAICAAGEQQVLGRGLSYTYGTWGSGEAQNNAEYGAFCYAPGQKKDNDGTDRTIGCNCI